MSDRVQWDAFQAALDLTSDWRSRQVLERDLGRQYPDIREEIDRLQGERDRLIGVVLNFLPMIVRDLKDMSEKDYLLVEYILSPLDPGEGDRIIELASERPTLPDGKGVS